MKRMLLLLLISATLIGSSSRCTLFRRMGGGPELTAKASAVQALVTTTRAAVLIMTAAGIAYDSGFWGEPGSDRAEATWNSISAESIRMNMALTEWSEAIKVGKDSSSEAAVVRQALAVISALMPAARKPAQGSTGESDLDLDQAPQINRLDLGEVIQRFARPDDFRRHRQTAVLGGAK